MHLEPRRDLYRVLGALALAPPTDALLSTLASSGAFAALQQHAPDAAMRDALGLMATDLARGEAHYPEVRRDHIALFVGPKKKLAPPWESVYRSTDRLVMQEQAAEVLRAYATHRIGFEGMGRLPADHAGYELEFVSILLDRSVRSEKARALRSMRS